MAKTVIGFFDNRNEAEQVVEQLAKAGISRDRVDIPSGRSDNNAATDISKSGSGQDYESGITRFFKSLFGTSHDEAHRYSRVASNSECMIIVHALSDMEAHRAADLLDEFGAIDVDELEARYDTASGTRPDRGDPSDGREGLTERSQSIPATREESKLVGKRMEEHGGNRLRSRIIDRPVEEHVRLREEHVRVERNPVNRPVRSDEMGAFREGEIELTERAEVPVVNKEARVVEEVRLSKEVSEQDATIRDTARSADVESQGRNGRTDDRGDVNLSDQNLLRDGDLRDHTGYQDLHDTDYRKTDNDLRDNLRDNTNRSL